jgi:hypothetical protein
MNAVPGALPLNLFHAGKGILKTASGLLCLMNRRDQALVNKVIAKRIRQLIGRGHRPKTFGAAKEVMDLFIPILESGHASQKLSDRVISWAARDILDLDKIFGRLLPTGERDRYLTDPFWFKLARSFPVNSPAARSIREVAGNGIFWLSLHPEWITTPETAGWHLEQIEFLSPRRYRRESCYFKAIDIIFSASDGSGAWDGIRRRCLRLAESAEEKPQLAWAA